MKEILFDILAVLFGLGFLCCMLIEMKYRQFYKHMKVGQKCMFFIGEERHPCQIHSFTKDGRVVIQDEFGVQFVRSPQELYL